MTQTSVFLRHRGWLLVGSLFVPLLAAVAMAGIRDQIENTNAALVLVLLVVAAASTGVRSAGVLAALSSAVWFDFFLSAPYLKLTITDRSDIVTTVLLVLVGLAVTELALWGRRQQGRSSRSEGFLDGVNEAAGAVAAGDSPDRLIAVVERQLVTILDLDACAFSPSTTTDLPLVRPDGTVVQAGRVLDVERHGLPTDTKIRLPARNAALDRGEFLLTAAAHVARPSRPALQVAVTLADQVGAAIATRPGQAAR